jgi:glutamate dehydrogenase
MTDEVAVLVLRNNYLQSLALSLAERRAVADMGLAERLMQRLEQEARLDRAVEFLPDTAAVTERVLRGEGLTRPELAVLLAYAKLALHDGVLESRVPDDPYLGRELARYFPALLRERFPDAIATHRLRRDIIATQLANAIINRGGPAIVPRLADETGSDAPTIAAAFAATRDSFGLSELNAAIDALDDRVPGGLQLDLYAALQDLMLDRIVWFIRNVELTGGMLDAVVARYRGGIAEVEQGLDDTLPRSVAEARKARAAGLTAQGVPRDLARRLSALGHLAAGTDIVLMASRTGQAATEVAAIHFAVEETFRLRAILDAARGIAVTDHFDRLALHRAIDEIADAHRRLTAQAVATGGTGPAAIDTWCASRAGPVKRIRETVESIVGPGLTLSKLMVAAGLLADLAQE